MEEREIKAKVKVLKERYPEVVQAILAEGGSVSATDKAESGQGQVAATATDTAAQDAMIETMLGAARAAGRA